MTTQALAADRAHRLAEGIAEIRRQGDNLFLDLGVYLAEFTDVKGWQALGHESKDAFLRSPEIGLSRREAYRYERVARTFVLSSLLPERPNRDRLATIGITKLDIVAGAVDLEPEAIEHWLTMAEALSDDDLVQVVRGAHGHVPPDLHPDVEAALKRIAAIARAALDGRKDPAEAFDEAADAAMAGMAHVKGLP